MNFNDTDILYLRGSCGGRFTELPDSCPPKIMAQIIHRRAQQIGYKPSQPSQVAEPVGSDLRDKLRAVSLL